MQPAEKSDTTKAIVPLRAAKFGLFILTFINLFNYLDRWVVAALVDSLKRDLHLSDSQAGSLASGFIIVYMLASPVFGRLGDTRSRTRLIAAGVAIWSLATALGGFARNFTSLFIARASVGIGEAAYGTISPGLLADYFPSKMRGRVFSIFFAAIPIGSALGYVLGASMDVHFGWRTAFFVAGVPGLLLSLLVLALPDPPRGVQDENDPEAQLVAHGQSAGGWRDYLDLVRNRPYLLTVLGYAAYTFAVGGLAFWMPEFLFRARGMAKAEATVQFGTIVVVTGFVGTFVGGWLGDYLLKFSSQAYLWVSGIATVAAAPLTFVALTAQHRTIYFTSLVIAELLIFASTGPVNSAIVNYVTPRERATAVALSIFLIHLLGDVPSPVLIGKISDMSSLGTAVLIVPVAVLIAGLIWIVAALGKVSGVRSRPAES